MGIQEQVQRACYELGSRKTLALNDPEAGSLVINLRGDKAYIAFFDDNELAYRRTTRNVEEIIQEIKSWFILVNQLNSL